MKLNDPIYNFIFSHKLPVARGENPVAEYLCSYYDEFFTDLTIALQQTANRELRSECYELLKNNLHIIKNLCDDREDILPLFSKLRIRIRADVDYNSAMSPLS